MLLVRRRLRPGRPQVMRGGATRNHRPSSASDAAGRGGVRGRCPPRNISFLSRGQLRRWKRVTQLIASGLRLLLRSLCVRAVRGRGSGRRRRCRRVLLAGHGPSHSSCMIDETFPVLLDEGISMSVFSLQLALCAVHHRLLVPLPFPRRAWYVVAVLLPPLGAPRMDGGLHFPRALVHSLPAFLSPLPACLPASDSAARRSPANRQPGRESCEAGSLALPPAAPAPPPPLSVPVAVDPAYQARRATFPASEEDSCPRRFSLPSLH